MRIQSAFEVLARHKMSHQENVRAVEQFPILQKLNLQKCKIGRSTVELI